MYVFYLTYYMEAKICMCFVCCRIMYVEEKSNILIWWILLHIPSQKYVEK